MSRAFRDTHTFKVDSKGRVSIPAAFRRVLAAGDPSCENGECPELVIVYGDERRHYLECFTVERMSQIDAKIEALPLGSPPRKLLERLYHSQALTTNVDDTGRLVLPLKLRKKIGLTNEAVFVGRGSAFEIWEPAAHAAHDAAVAEALYSQLPPDFDINQFLDQPDLAARLFPRPGV